jgi:hypothetical protein
MHSTLHAQELAAFLKTLMKKAPGFKAFSESKYIELIHSYYLPVFFWAEAQLEKHQRQSSRSSCFVLGLSCVQV